MAALPGCRKSLRLFSTARNNVVIFVPPCGTKIVASRRKASTLGVLHARLARQGFARHLILFEAGFAPSSSPCVKESLTTKRGFLDKLEGGPPGGGPPSLFCVEKIPAELLTKRRFLL